MFFTLNIQAVGKKLSHKVHFSQIHLMAFLSRDGCQVEDGLVALKLLFSDADTFENGFWGHMIKEETTRSYKKGVQINTNGLQMINEKYWCCWSAK